MHRRSRKSPPGGAAVGGFLQSAAMIGHLCQKSRRPGRPRSAGQGGDRGVAGEGAALGVAVEEGMVIGERFHQRGGFMNQIVVVSALRTKDGSFQEPPSRSP